MFLLFLLLLYWCVSFRKHFTLQYSVSICIYLCHSFLQQSIYTLPHHWTGCKPLPRKLPEPLEPSTSGTALEPGTRNPKCQRVPITAPASPQALPGKDSIMQRDPYSGPLFGKKNMLYAFRVISTWEAQYQINSDWTQSNKSWFYHLS